jgi:hypothetical protein
VKTIGWLKGEALHAADKTRIAVTNFNLSYLAVGVAIKRGFFQGRTLGCGGDSHEHAQHGDGDDNR